MPVHQGLRAHDGSGPRLRGRRQHGRDRLPLRLEGSPAQPGALRSARLGDQVFGPPADDADLGALWRRLIEAFTGNQTFWIANLETVLRAQRDPELRSQVAEGLRQGRSGMAREVTGTPEAELTEETVRTLGSVQLALVSGLMMQHLTDPESAPTADEVLAGLRALAARLPENT
ncbi:TetR family transcriptional regulator C-terminal domain-containing protein [Streptomyces zhihengii]